MKQFLRVFGLQLNQRFGLSVLRAGFREDKLKTLGKAALYLIVALSLGSIVFMYGWLLHAMLPGFQLLGLEKVFLGAVLLIDMVMVFVMGLFYLIGLLFFSKDTEFLASLPIRPRVVFAAKFGQVLLGEIATSLVLLLPAFIIYGIADGGGVAFWLRAALVSLLAPCIPLAISGLLSLLLMRFNALWRRRDLLTVIGALLLVVLVFVGQMMLSSTIPDLMDPVKLLAFIQDSSRILQVAVSVFPPSGWAAEGLVQGGGMLLLFSGISIAALTAVILTAGRIYYAGAMAQLETSANRRSVKLEGKRVKQRGVMLSLFMREWRIVLRTPVYALNGLTMILMGPLMLLLPLFMQGASMGGEMEFLVNFVGGLIDPRIIVFVLAGVFAAISSINPAATTTLSREGKLFYLLRVIPVSPAKQILAKFLFGASTMLLTALPMALTSAFVFHISLELVFGAFALGVVASIAPLAISLLPDMLHPKLSWNSETEAIKQNANSLLGMLVGWLYLCAVGYGCYHLLRTPLSMAASVVLVGGLALALGIALIFLLCHIAGQRWRAIEG